MSARVKIVVDTGGPVAVKTAVNPEEVTRLAYEAARLRRAAHPGVVAVLDHQIVGDAQAELRTRYAGRSLDGWQGGLARLAGIGAAVAATLADLHELGIVHGRLAPSHVLVGMDGRPRLCGFAALDPGVPADDVAALGRLLGQLAERTGIERRGTFGWRRAPFAERRAFEDVLAQATDPAPERRPSARSLAGSLLVAVPDAELPPAGPWSPAPAAVLARQGLEPDLEPTGDDPADLDDATGAAEADDLYFDDGLDGALDDRGDDAVVLQVFGDQSDTAEEELFVDRPWTLTPRPGRPHRSHRPRHSRPSAERGSGRRVIGAATVVGVGGLVVALAALLVLDDSPPPSASPAPEEARTPQTVPCPTPPSAGGETEVDVDGDGCPDRVDVDDDGVVHVGGDRWAVGEPGDVVAVGDWDCDGTATPAAYRPATGDVFVFEGWADDGHPLAAEPVAQVPGGVTLDAGRDGDGCDAPVVATATGEQHTVAVER